jgi:hypothetical protein
MFDQCQTKYTRKYQMHTIWNTNFMIVLIRLIQQCYWRSFFFYILSQISQNLTA